jgi:DNA mismatch repair protein MutS2
VNAAFDRRSQACLDWPEVLVCLAGQARSERGRAACASLPWAESTAEARAWLGEVAEVASLLRAGLSLPALDFPDVDAFVQAAEQGAILGAEELRPIASFCEVAAAWVRFFATAGVGGDGDESTAPAVRAPVVAGRVQALDPGAALAAEIRATFDAAGDIRDSVSPTLARLRRERESLSARVRSTADELMRGEEFAGVLQDQFVTLRGDRYVLPLRASAKSLGLGIVHDTSRTGETVFVEPTALVVMNNRLKLADLEIEREIRRILEQLARQVADAAPALRANGDVLTALDVVAAKARLGVAYDGAPPIIVDEARVMLTRARHPLLVIRGAEQNFAVIANDVALRDDAAKVLIISGPNAGGKTVLLKTVGVATLLVRAGMLVPAAAGGSVGFFDDVLADVGDRQSVMGDLSTFSAHLQNLVETLRRTAAEPPRRALVLLDELMAGTNPEQGAALARATAERLAAAPGLSIITTHYDSLKGLAEGDGRFCNAGMEYDSEHLRPTFRLKQGTPGRSYALDIAARMGLPDELLSRARSLAGDASVGLEQVITNLEEREAALRDETEQLAATRQSLAESEADQRRAEEALVRRERELGKHSRAAIEASVREARESLRAIVREAQQAGTARAAEEARLTVAATAEAAMKQFPVEESPATPAPPALVVGARVHVPAMDAPGIVVKAPDARGRVKVAVGAITLDVDAASLGAGTAAPVKTMPSRPAESVRLSHSPTAAASVPSASAVDELALSFPTAATTLDLRGERVDEAVGRLEEFLDRAALDGRSPVFIIHGHGTGALRKAVREHLNRSRYVRRFQPGGKGQGGDGVTVIAL